MGPDRNWSPSPKGPFLKIYRFYPIFDPTVMGPNHGGDPLGPILGTMDWGQKMGPHHNWSPSPKGTFLIVYRFSQNIDPTVIGQITVGTPRAHLGANGVPLGPKMGPHRNWSPSPKGPFFKTSGSTDFTKISTLW